MDTKKIFSGICAVVCATTFAIQQPAAEAWGISLPMSASEQEKHAHHLILKRVGGEPTSNSDVAKKFTPIIHKIQKRICNANRLVFSAQKYQHSGDYKTIIHPAIIVDNYNKSSSVGAGYIYVGDGSIMAYTKSKMQIVDQFDYMALEKLIAHEITHNISGHAIWKSKKYKRELVADQGVAKLTDNLPEGGWGIYLVGLNRNNYYYEQSKEIEQSWEEETKGKISFNYSDTRKVNYNARNGKSYELKAHPLGYDESSAYFGGQLAYCIAKGALTPDSIQIVNNHLRNEINFDGDYLLVCKSPKLPNGYRVLAGIGNSGRPKNFWDGILKVEKDATRINNPLGEYDSLYAKAQANRLVDGWRIWLACAVASDFANNGR